MAWTVEAFAGKACQGLATKFCPTALQEHYQQSVYTLVGALKQSECQDFGMIPLPAWNTASRG